MAVFRLSTGRHGVVCAAFVLTLLAGPALARAADSFPFERTLILDVEPIPPIKRVPLLTVERNGDAVIGLWCKTVRGRVEVGDTAIRIEAGPLPDALPQYMIAGQCTDERMKADQDMLDALTQATGWRRQGEGVVLEGPTPLRFLASDH